MKECPSCHYKEIRDFHKFCGVCGLSLLTPEPQQSVKTNITDIKISGKEIRLSHGKDAYEFLSRNINVFGKELDFTDYWKFGFSFAESLGKLRMYDEYRKFIKEYNFLIDTKFLPAVKEFKDMINYLFCKGMILIPISHESWRLKDKTDIFSKDEFSLEAKLEETLTSSINNLFDESIATKQQVIGNGRSDICVKFEDNIYAIELKKSTALRKDIFQAYEYKQSINNVVPILIASKISDEVIELANELGVTCFEYNLCRFKNSDVYQLVEILQMNDFDNDDVFFDLIHETNQCYLSEIDFGFIEPNDQFEITKEKQLNIMKTILSLAN